MTTGTSRACAAAQRPDRSAGLQPALAGQPLVQDDQRRLLGAKKPQRRPGIRRVKLPIPSPRNASSIASACRVRPSRPGPTAPAWPAATDARRGVSLASCAARRRQRPPAPRSRPRRRRTPPATRRAELGLGVLDDAIERVVVPKRVVVGQREPPGPGTAAHRERVLDGAMAPARLGRVLGGGVLRVMDHEVGARQELGVAPVLALVSRPRRSPAGARRARGRTRRPARRRRPPAGSRA